MYPVKSVTFKGLFLIIKTTKVIIASRISSIMNADKIIVLEEGVITGLGTHEELLKSNQMYKDIYDIQLGGDLHE